MSAAVPRVASARFQAPAYVRSLVERRRLLAMLQAGRDRQLVVIHAPAGYGKTTLVVQWVRVLESEGCAVAWLGLHRDDNDVSWFSSHLLEAVRRALPTAEPLVDELLQLLEQNPDDADRYVGAALLDQIGQHGGGLVLVFDDWHLIEDARVHGVLVHLLDFAPPCRGWRSSRSSSGRPLSNTTSPPAGPPRAAQMREVGRRAHVGPMRTP